MAQQRVERGECPEQHSRDEPAILAGVIAGKKEHADEEGHQQRGGAHHLGDGHLLERAPFPGAAQHRVGTERDGLQHPGRGQRRLETHVDHVRARAQKARRNREVERPVPVARDLGPEGTSIPDQLAVHVSAAFMPTRGR